MPALGAGALSTSADLPSGGRPVIAGQAPPSPTSYGLCNGPQNATNWPQRPVPVEHGECADYQRYQATSLLPSNAPSARAAATALPSARWASSKHTWKNYVLRADWGDAPLTASTCATARIAAVALGYRCENAACMVGDWERIGAAKSRNGTWNATSKICYIELAFAKGDRIYNTLNVAFIATQGSGASAVRNARRGRSSRARATGNASARARRRDRNS